MTENNPPPDSTPKPTRKSFCCRKLLYVLGGLLILIIVAGNAFILGTKTVTPSTFITPSNAPARQDPAQLDDLTASWPVYQNTHYKYQIKYPSDWAKYESGFEYTRFFQGPHKSGQPYPETYLSLQIKDNPQKLDLASWQQTNAGILKPGAKYFQDTNLTILEISPTITDTANQTLYQNIFAQMISTFQFTTSKVTPTPVAKAVSYSKPTDWKTVTMSTYNISFCLPQNWNIDTNQPYNTVYYERDLAYRPSMFTVIRNKYNGGSTREQFITQKVAYEQDAQQIRNSAKVQEYSINNKKVLKIDLYSFPSALVFVDNNWLYEIQLASSELPNPQHPNYLQEMFTVVGCFKSF